MNAQFLMQLKVSALSQSQQEGALNLQRYLLSCYYGSASPVIIRSVVKKQCPQLVRYADQLIISYSCQYQYGQRSAAKYLDLSFQQLA